MVRLDVRNEALETHMVKRSRGGVVRAADLPDLEGIWMDVWTGLEAATPPETYRVLAWLR